MPVLHLQDRTTLCAWVDEVSRHCRPQRPFDKFKIRGRGSGVAKKIAELFVEVLAAAGVERIYGVAGDSLNGITESVLKRNGIEWVGVRHEETAAIAAGAEAALTGKLAVCAGSCGPGNLHLINGLYDAHRSRVPVLAIAAQIPSQEIGCMLCQTSGFTGRRTRWTTHF